MTSTVVPRSMSVGQTGDRVSFSVSSMPLELWFGKLMGTMPELTSSIALRSCEEQKWSTKIRRKLLKRSYDQKGVDLCIPL